MPAFAFLFLSFLFLFFSFLFFFFCVCLCLLWFTLLVGIIIHWASDYFCTGGWCFANVHS
ncbi:hypothetical protein K432DRAFT_112839 [Lepidopterella palustris CBS 459.81]|uniref:Uncharacterized protein n=1 Tax=Lepidopterella palustris CBS 459.81 TaxID=1314670 RepID=A0A8E2E5P8_9PEZI|nr:hypothetical protein K432DRAFT_112839 [Lepidopterella palustris CBS 459.81]